MTVHIVGVRHHSPACAAVVRHVLERVQPSHVLIEGPVDVNDRMWELSTLDHTLPIAMFHFLSDRRTHVAAFTPFCTHSPEWVAIRWGARHDAEVRFIDLPSWAKAFHHNDNRTADGEDRYGDVVTALCERLGVDGPDGAWDHLFEQAEDAGVLEERLAQYFAGLRTPEVQVEAKHLAREDFMARCIAWAADQPGDTVVVCGGYHKPALERLWPTMPRRWPELPEPGEDARSGTYLVPWSFERLDAFAGYSAGLPSPGWYDTVHRSGPQEGARQMLDQAIASLREAKVPISAADRIAVEVQLQALTAIRGHRVPLRSDVLDALTSGLIKEALDVPPPWTRRAGVQRATDARLVQVLRVFQGDAKGKLATGTPQPPLVDSVLDALKKHGLPWGPPPGATVSLDLYTPAELERSRVLHRMKVLGLPGVRRTDGPADPAGASHAESWQLIETDEFVPAVLEASAYGASLGHAAERRLQERLAVSTRLDDLTAVLVDALFVGLDSMADDILLLTRDALSQVHEFGDLGQAIRLMLDLWRYDTVFVAAGHTSVGEILAQLLSTALYLFESAAGEEPSRDRQLTAAALRDLLRDGPVHAGDRVLAQGVFTRRSADPHAPPDLRGAAFGLRIAGGADLEAEALQTIREVSPDIIGDWLAGLFAVSRDTLTDSEALLTALDERLRMMSLHEFLHALPALRIAFAWFPPRERRNVGASVFGLHGVDEAAARRILRAPVDVAATTRGVELDRDVENVLFLYGQVSHG